MSVRDESCVTTMGMSYLFAGPSGNVEVARCAVRKGATVGCGPDRRALQRPAPTIDDMALIDRGLLGSRADTNDRS